MIIYRGPSLLDNKPIVVILTGLNKNSSNPKTGSMLQTYILRSDIDPREASKTGKDFSICGNCIHRGEAHNDPTKTLAKNRSCYVTIFQGPLNVYKAFKKDKYKIANGHNELAKLGQGKKIRLGTYGDPSAVPSYIWDSLLSLSLGHTAYSHQANIKTSSFNPKFMMQSADTKAEAVQAWKLGQRTFRVVTNIKDIVKGQEINCPASEEMGRKTTCKECGLCAGSKVKAKSIAIVAHGAGSNNFNS